MSCHIKGYKNARTRSKHALSYKHFVAYKAENSKTKKDYMSQIIQHAKRYPVDSTKYSKVLKWTDSMKAGVQSDMKRITYFDELSRKSKGKPGPATYKKEKCLIPRIRSVYYR